MQLEVLLAAGVLVKDTNGNLKGFQSQDQQPTTQSQIPVIKRSESGLSHSSHPSYSSHLRKGSNAKAKDQPKDEDMNHQ